MSEADVDDPVVAISTGWDRFSRADWQGAHDAFAAAHDADSSSAEALDGLGQASWWLDRRGDAIEYRRRAFVEFRRRGDAQSAAIIAVYLAAEARIDGEDAAASGWVARARRLVGDAGDSRARAWLAIEEAKRETDPKAIEEHAESAVRIAVRIVDPDLECAALAQAGRAKVIAGQVDEGVALLDEAMTIALGGESQDPMATGDACCTTLTVCDGLIDLRRSRQWCEAVVAFTERRRFVPLQSWCRGIYGGVLIRAGDWEGADRVLRATLAGSGSRAGDKEKAALVALAELRLRQGSADAARALLEGIDDEAAARPLLIRVLAALGELELAHAHLERAGRPRDAETERSAAELALRAGEQEQALESANALAGAAGARDDLRGQARLIEGVAKWKLGDTKGALRALDEAMSVFTRLGLPHERALVRLARAEAEADAGSPLAADIAKRAREELDRLGARGDADRAAALLRRLGLSGRKTTRSDGADLTSREREVLALVADGLTNAQIAERLVIAPKTAEHHVSNVLGKLGVRSRAQAAAHAVRLGLKAPAG